MNLLERLVGAPGVPGREAPIRSVIEAHVRAANLFDEITTDALGSLICRRRPRPVSGAPARERPLRVLAAAHMDQIGFLVSHVSADGLLSLHPVGAFDVRTLLARRVTVYTEDGEALPGVLNAPGRPLHTAPPADLARLPDLSALFVDLSLGGDVVRSKVRLGDMVVVDGAFAQIGESVVAAGLDNRVGCWALIRAIEDLDRHDCEIWAAWTVQEELGSRGAGPLGFGVAPDIGISCDTTLCSKVPGVAAEHHITQPGEGISIQIADSSTLADMDLVRSIEAIAREKRIRCQRSLMLGGGQDGAYIQRSRAGVRTLVLSCPLKYMHTSAEMVHRSDLDSYRALLSAYLASL
jgi:endoglucanase